MGLLEYTDGILRHKVNSFVPVIMFNISIRDKSVSFFLSQLGSHNGNDFYDKF